MMLTIDSARGKGHSDDNTADIVVLSEVHWPPGIFHRITGAWCCRYIAINSGCCRWYVHTYL